MSVREIRRDNQVSRIETKWDRCIVTTGKIETVVRDLQSACTQIASLQQLINELFKERDQK